MHIGDKVGKYELLYPIGEGGMGEVWVGRLRSLGGFESYVAVKVIHGRFAREKRFRDMFLDEARVSAMISHPNVVSTQDVAVEGDMLYQIMEYVDGDSLAGLQASMAEHNERMPVPVALRIAADVCAGLHAAHELRGPDGRPRGIVHRDVSPQNILVGASGAVKLIDFGVALMQDRLAEDSQGTLKGKLRYMPPEQATGSKVDRRADVYALGAVLYEMVSGYLPFDDRTEAVYFRALIQGDAPAPLPPEIPEDVADVIARAMATKKEDRYPTAEQMGEDLATILRKRPANISSFVEIHLSQHAQRRRSAIKQSAADAAGETSPALALEESTEQSAAPAGAVPSRPRAPAAPPAPAAGPDLNREVSLSLAYPTPGPMELSTADFLTGSRERAAAALPDVPSLDVPAEAPRAPAPARPRPGAPIELDTQDARGGGGDLQLDGLTPHE
ncbi:MAG TPA: serine/threonine-protein kinase, partial [Polyangiaceae bacterium]|nr:serine/threonine-protein kinase [Polyangiaceae bacterium]